MPEVRLPIPTSLGLNLHELVSRLRPGELVDAYNKGRGFFGPRHAFKRIDYIARSRAVASLDGTNDFLQIPCTPAQWALGVSFSVDIFFKLLAVPSADNGWLFTTAHAADKCIDIWIDTDGKIHAYVEDDTSGSDTLVSTTELSANDICRVRVARGSGTTSLLIGTGGRMVREAVTTSLDSAKVMNPVAALRYVGKPPSYAGGSPEYLNMLFGQLMIRSVEDLSAQYCMGEYPTPRGQDVLGCWGELIGSDKILDASRFVTHATGDGISSVNTFVERHDLVQGMMHTVTRDGREYNFAASGGILYREDI